MLDERLTNMRELMEKHGLFPLRGRVLLDLGCGHGTDLTRLVNSDETHRRHVETPYFAR